MKLILVPTILLVLLKPAIASNKKKSSQSQDVTKRHIRGQDTTQGDRILQTDIADAITSAVSEINDIIDNRITIAPTFVRLGFHDCVGGCDGCVDMTNPDNAGLEDAINALSSVVSNPQYTEAGLSRADLWALAAITGANYAKPDTSFFFEPAYYGRTNCEDVGLPCLDANNNEVSCTATTGPHRDLPSADLDTEDVLDFFNDNFDFTDDETVALMGAHSIGRALRANSGFDGSAGWVNNENTLDNEYYRQIVGDEGDLFNGPNWNQNEVINNGQIPDRFQWERNARGNDGGPELIMLNSDIALVRTFGDNLDMETGEVSCRFRNNNACDAASTLDQMGVYRNNNELWLEDFKNVFEKMLIHGYNIGCDSIDCISEVIGYNPSEDDERRGNGGRGGNGGGNGGGNRGGNGGGRGRQGTRGRL